MLGQNSEVRFGLQGLFRGEGRADYAIGVFELYEAFPGDFSVFRVM